MHTADPRELAARLHRRRGPVGLLFDYDGTLTPIVQRPGEATLEDDVRTRLLNLVARPDTHVAIVTGRGLEQLRALTGALPGITLAVNGGLRVVDADGDRVHPEVARARPLLERAVARLEQLAARAPGAVVEDKTYSLALHFRACPQLEPMLAAAMNEELEPGLRVIHGKAVFELQPDVAWDKGAACTELLDRWGVTDACLFAGDDTIDEPAFEAVQDRGGLGVRVGDASATAANERLPDLDAIRVLLTALGAAGAR